MKKRILAIVVVTTVVHLLVLLGVIVVVARYNYEVWIEDHRRAVVTDVTRRLYDYARLLSPIEADAQRLARRQLETVVSDLSSRFDLSSPDPPPPGTASRLAALHPFTEVYIIGANDEVLDASLTSEEGLVLSSMDAQTRSLLQTVRTESRIVVTRVAMSATTGRLVVYSLLKPPDVDWIVELSVDIRSLTEERFGGEYERFLFDEYWSRQIGVPTDIRSIDVAVLRDVAAWSLLSGTSRGDLLDRRLRERIRDEADGVLTTTHGTPWKDGRLAHYQMADVSNLGYHFADDLVIETVFDVAGQVRLLITAVLVVAGLAIVLTAVILFLAGRYLQRRLLIPLEALQTQFQRAADGRYEMVETEVPAAWHYPEYRPIFTSLHTMIERITAREDRLRQENLQKQILLQEIHHRVKNNLQIMASLLNLERSRVDVRPADEALQAAESRIDAMAAVHTLLYQSERLGHVDMAEFIVQHGEEVFALYDLPTVHIVPQYRLDPLVLPMDEAVPLGLILTELLTNAVKHGTEPDGTLHIETTLTVSSALEADSAAGGDSEPGDGPAVGGRSRLAQGWNSAVGGDSDPGDGPAVGGRSRLAQGWNSAAGGESDPGGGPAQAPDPAQDSIRVASTDTDPASDTGRSEQPRRADSADASDHGDDRDVAVVGPTEYTIEIRDHGRGFGPHAPARIGALGFQLVRQLAAQIHASVELDDALDGGARAVIRRLAPERSSSSRPTTAGPAVDPPAPTNGDST